MFRYSVLFILLFVAGCTSFSSSVKGSGKIVKQERKVENFEHVVFGGDGIIILKQGDKEGLQIEADDNLFPYLTSQTADGTLRLEQKKGSLKPSKPIKYYITLKKISSVSISGQGEVSSEGVLKAENLMVNVSGGGTVDLHLNVNQLSSGISGSARYILKGSANTQEIFITGSCIYDAAGLASRDTAIQINGYAEATLNVQDKLAVNITGNGVVYYQGSPKITQTISGSGKIEKLQKKS